MKIRLVSLTLFSLVLSAAAQTCTTQSQMQPADRDALASTARTLALAIQANDQAALRPAVTTDLAKNFAGVTSTVSTASTSLKGKSPAVDQLYLLDASTLKSAPDGAAPDAQFFCALNRSQAEADFNIPALPSGRYAFAIVHFDPSDELSFLLRQEAGKWLLAGLYPKQQTAAGHDGLWYWREARSFAAQKQLWDSFLYYQEAQLLLQPAPFVSSTHLEALHTESTSALPPALSNGISPDNPFVIKGPDGTEYRFTALTVDNSLAKDKLDVAAHLKVDQLGDPAAARRRNLAAMTALLTAYPELRKPFHGVWIFTEAPGLSPVANESAMDEIH